jgi:hypothetical protein
MKPSIRFPREADTIYEQAVAFRRLTPTDRLLAILDLIASGVVMLRQSPDPQVSQRLRDAQEAEWQRLQRELFTRHGR